MRSPQQLREDAFAIWSAGVAAVQSDQLVYEQISASPQGITIGDTLWDPANGGKLVVIGAGKAGAGMTRGLERVFKEAPELPRPTGWVNVPDDCTESTSWIQLHPARPAGVNLPTERGIAGTQEIISRVKSLSANDLCICLISGGGSALLPMPIDGVSIQEKQLITQRLANQGANIAELNTVRKSLSTVKGGGLLDAMPGGTMVTLVISDVLGDPLDLIASGPTQPDPIDFDEAVRVLKRFGQASSDSDQYIIDLIKKRQVESSSSAQTVARKKIRTETIVIGNNATAVDAAGMEAERRGYSHAMTAATEPEGSVNDIALHHSRMAIRMNQRSGPDCLISGGEPTVQLPNDGTGGKGGRNQQLALLAGIDVSREAKTLDGICILSGGTDGEDGPTDAAGAYVDSDIMNRATQQQLSPKDFANRCDAYTFFENVGGLIKTGPTHTNVCDVRVIVVGRESILKS